MSNYQQPDFRVPVSLGPPPASLTYNSLQITAVPLGFTEHPDFRKLPVVKGVADFPVYYNALQIPPTPVHYIQPGSPGSKG